MKIGISTQKDQFVQNAGGHTQAAEDDQRDTMHNALHYAITM